MRAREVVKVIEANDGEFVRQVGSHRRYRVIRDGVTASTAVPMHSGDVPTGTLHKMDRDLAPALGKGWLTR